MKVKSYETFVRKTAGLNPYNLPHRWTTYDLYIALYGVGYCMLLWGMDQMLSL